jgi:hypothetical protein
MNSVSTAAHLAPSGSKKAINRRAPNKGKWRATVDDPENYSATVGWDPLRLEVFSFRVAEARLSNSWNVVTSFGERHD